MVRWDEERVGVWSCLTAVAIGALSFAAWLAKVGLATTIIRGEPPVMPNTALALVLIGSAGALRHRPDAARAKKALSVVLAGVVLVFGAASLAEYAFGVELGFDELFVQTSVGPHPGRPSPLTALALMLLAAALCIFDTRATRRARPSEWLAILAGLCASIGLIGMILGAGPLYRLSSAPVIGMAMPTAVALVFVSVGLLLERPSAGVMAIASSRGPGGVMLRRLLPTSIAAPVLLGLLVMRLSIAWDVDELPLVIALHASALIVVSATLLTAIAAPLNRTHAALEATRARTQSLFEQAPDGIFVANLEGRYTDVNDAGCRMLGRRREDILGKTILDLIPAEDAPRLEQSRIQLLEGGVQLAEWRLRHADGHWVPVEVSARILPDGRWQGFVRDINERVRVEGEHRLFADVGAAIGSTLRTEEMLPRIASLVVRDFADVCVIELIEEDGARRRTGAKREPSSRFDFEAVAIDEAEPRFDPRTITVPLATRGEPFGVLALLSISPSRAYDAEDMRVAQELAHRLALAVENARLYAAAQRAIQLRDEVLGIVAHDLRNPLGIILMQAGILRDQREATDVIKRAAHRMDRLIRDLLDVTRMEAGRLSLERSRVPAAQAVNDAVETQRPIATTKPIELRVELPRDLPAIFADRHRLLQVFENLIGNAVKFSDRGGKITIGATPREADVVFWVRDTGSGIAPEDLPHVFDRFWQARSKAARHGAGLGLPIVKGIVEAHGGRIWVESVQGHGATFFFTIPRDLREEAQYSLTM